jgi:hypothetical protein
MFNYCIYIFEEYSSKKYVNKVMKYKKISENFVNYNGMNKYINGFEKVYF